MQRPIELVFACRSSKGTDSELAVLCLVEIQGTRRKESIPARMWHRLWKFQIRFISSLLLLLSIPPGPSSSSNLEIRPRTCSLRSFRPRHDHLQRQSYKYHLFPCLEPFLQQYITSPSILDPRSSLSSLLPVISSPSSSLTNLPQQSTLGVYHFSKLRFLEGIF